MAFWQFRVLVIFWPWPSCWKSATLGVLRKLAILLPIAAAHRHNDYPMASPRAAVTVKTVIGIWAGHFQKRLKCHADTTNDFAATMIERRPRRTRLLPPEPWAINWLEFATTLCEIRWHLTKSWFCISLALQRWSRIEVGENPFFVIGTPLLCLTDKSRRITFLLDLPLSWVPGGWPTMSPICVISMHWTWQGTDVFLGSANRTRGRKEKVTFLTISFTGLDPDGCLVVDQLKVYAKHLKYRVQVNKRSCFRAGWWPCKKTTLFLRWIRVFYWQGPFNGCQYMKSGKSACMFCIPSNTKPHISLISGVYFRTYALRYGWTVILWVAFRIFWECREWLLPKAHSGAFLSGSPIF